VDELRGHDGTVYRIVLGADADAGWLRDLPGLTVKDVDGSSALVDVGLRGREQELLRVAMERGPVREFAPVRPALSDVFREATSR
jgi:ABC-2 type transport system ATP-binding protein